jgi:hypothetical protein
MSEKIMISVYIPVKQYIKKYLHTRYGEKHTLSKRSLFGILLFHILDKKCPKPDYNYKDYPEKYEIMISEYYFKSNGFNIGHKKKLYLALCFEKIFYEDLMLFIDIVSTDLKVKPIAAIRMFLKKYGITDLDVDFDTIYRQYQREKKSKKDKAEI